MQFPRSSTSSTTTAQGQVQNTTPPFTPYQPSANANAFQGNGFSLLNQPLQTTAPPNPFPQNPNGVQQTNGFTPLPILLTTAGLNSDSATSVTALSQLNSAQLNGLMAAYEQLGNLIFGVLQAKSNVAAIADQATVSDATDSLNTQATDTMLKQAVRHQNQGKCVAIRKNKSTARGVIKPSGSLCDDPAVNGSRYCRKHDGKITNDIYEKYLSNQKR